jgi:hypothetical protein
MRPLMDASQSMASAPAARCSGVSPMFWFSQVSAVAIWSGKVEPVKIRATSESGSRAIGATS